MATTNELKNGMVLNLDGQLWSVVWFQHHKPGKGGAVVRTKLKNVLSGKVVDKTFNADVKVEVASVDKRDMTYLYNDGTSYVFMDAQTYEQLPVSPDTVGEASHFLLENQDAIVATNDGRVLYIELPASVELEQSFRAMGVDAGPSVQRRTRIGAASGLRLPPTGIFAHPTVREVAAFLLGRLLPATATAPTPPTPPTRRSISTDGSSGSKCTFDHTIPPRPPMSSCAEAFDGVTSTSSEANATTIQADGDLTISPPITRWVVHTI